jgi:hypothetical protein
MNARLRLLALVSVTLIVAGCGSTASSPSTSASSSPRVRCLADPREGSTRPLIYFFCIESP